MTGRLFSGPVDADSKAGPRARAEAIKARISVTELAPLLDAELSDTRKGAHVDCPACEGALAARITASGASWSCGCGESGDVIDFLKAAKGLSFAAACDELEALLSDEAAKPAADAPDLFNLERPK